MENATKEKIYLGSGKQVKDYDMVNFSLNLSKLKSDASDHIYEFNGEKYINLTMTKRKEVSQYGKTHTVSVNDFKPENKEEGQDLPF